MLGIFILGIEQGITILRRRAPAVSAGRKKRDAIVKYIADEFGDVKTVLDIGSGWGRVVRDVARKFPNATVTGVEIMPSPYIVSKIRCMNIRNVKLIRGDAFELLVDPKQKFDVGIAYLLHMEMDDVQKFLSSFKVLIAVDFPLPDVRPTKKIKIYRDRHADHYLYIYRSK